MTGTPGQAPPPLAAARILRVKMRLECGCGKVTVLRLKGGSIGETGRVYRCRRCGADHWFSVGAARQDEDEGVPGG